MDEAVSNAAFNAGGGLIAFFGEKIIFVYDVNSSAVGHLFTEQVASIGWSASTDELAVLTANSDSTKHVDGKEVIQYSVYKLLNDGEIKFIRKRGGKINSERSVLAATIDSSLRWVATGGGSCINGNQGSYCENMGVHIFDTKTGKLARRIFGHISEVDLLAWSGDGRLATGSRADFSYFLDNNILLWGLNPLWNLNGWISGSEIYIDTMPENTVGWLSDARWSRDGKRIELAFTDELCNSCASQDEDLRVGYWDISSRAFGLLEKEKHNLVDYVEKPNGPDGMRTLSWANKEAIFPAYSEESYCSNIQEKDADLDCQIQKNSNKNVDVLDKNGVTVVRLIGHTDWVSSASWSPDGSKIATCSSDGTARIWNASTGKEDIRLSVETETYCRAKWSPDGKWLLVSRPGRYLSPKTQVPVQILPVDIQSMEARSSLLVDLLSRGK